MSETTTTRVEYLIKGRKSGWLRGPYKDHGSAVAAANALAAQKAEIVDVERVTTVTTVRREHYVHIV